MSDVLERLNASLAGRYHVVRELAAGGMATVYLADDLKHERRVALKVFRPELSALLGTERFLNEIKVTANLHHPNILPLYDSGEADSLLYYVMPYVEGESLRDRLDREGELPVEESVRILREVADGLASAHRRGIVHRDIKPANVLLTEGHALVADFGVAKALSDARAVSGGDGGIHGPTEVGASVGTPAYMSPEQAAAEPRIDHRADIYGLGALAYELLTGRPPFERTSSPAVIAAVMTEAPDPVTRHRAAVPPGLEALIMRCLAKKPADRWQSADEVVQQLDLVATPAGGVAAGGAAAREGPRRRGRWGVAAVLAAVTAAAGIVGWVLQRDGGPDIELANLRQLTRDRMLEFDPALSPDGGEVAYAAGAPGDIHVYVRDLAGGRAIALTADRRGEQTRPRWTPGGREIVFFDGGNGWMRMPRFGGTAVSTPWEPLFRGDSVLFLRGDSVFVGAAVGGSPTFGAVVPPGAHSPAWSPDGTRIAFVTGNAFYVQTGNLGNIAPSTLWALELGGRAEPVRLTDSGSLNAGPVWLPDGDGLLFVSDREGPRDLYLLALARAGGPAGEPARLTTGLNPHSVSLSADGTVAAYSQLVYRTNVWAVELPDSGSVPLSQGHAVTRGNQTIEAHDVSPDGGLLAFDSNLDGAQDIYLLEAGATEPRRLTTDPGYDFHPSLSPDGREVVFHSVRHGSRDLFIIGTDGQDERRLTDDPGEEMNPEFSPDGLRILYRDRLTPGVFVIERPSLDGPWGEPRQIASVGPNAVWSPDSRRIAFASEGAVFVVSVAEPEEPRVVLEAPAGLAGLTSGIWSEDGREIYFKAVREDGVSGMFAVDTAGGPARPLVVYDDPTLSVQFTPSLGDGVLYLSVTEQESDIYVMDVVIR